MTESSRVPAPTEAAATAWRLTQLTEILRAAEAWSDEALRTLKDIDTDLPETASVTLSADAIVHLKRTLDDFGQLAERAATIANHLPRADVEVDYNEVATAAAHDLAAGILDPARVRWAAELLHYDIGRRALAEALRTSDTHCGWDDLTLQDLLTAFRQAPVTAVDELTAGTDMTPASEFTECSESQIALLAASLSLSGADR